MKHHELLISRADLALLQRAVGNIWVCYGMEASARAGAYALECVFVELKDRSLTVAAELAARDIDRGREDFSRILIYEGADGEPEARRAGNLFSHEAGQVVAGIHVVRDTLVGADIANATPKFSLAMDTSVIFEFADHAAVAFTKASYFSDDFFITRANSVGDLEIFDGSSEWESDLEVQYSQSRTVLSVAELLSR